MRDDEDDIDSDRTATDDDWMDDVRDDRLCLLCLVIHISVSGGKDLFSRAFSSWSRDERKSMFLALERVDDEVGLWGAHMLSMSRRQNGGVYSIF